MQIHDLPRKLIEQVESAGGIYIGEIFPDDLVGYVCIVSLQKTPIISEPIVASGAFFYSQFEEAQECARAILGLFSEETFEINGWSFGSTHIAPLEDYLHCGFCLKKIMDRNSIKFGMRPGASICLDCIKLLQDQSV